MSKELTGRDKTRAHCNELMYGFGYSKRARAIIWAAKDHSCPECSAGPFTRCINMSDLRKGIKPHLARENKQPHDGRVDWDKLLKALKERLGG